MNASVVIIIGAFFPTFDEVLGKNYFSGYIPRAQAQGTYQDFSSPLWISSQESFEPKHYLCFTPVVSCRCPDHTYKESKYGQNNTGFFQNQYYNFFFINIVTNILFQVN